MGFLHRVTLSCSLLLTACAHSGQQPRSPQLAADAIDEYAQSNSLAVAIVQGVRVERATHASWGGRPFDAAEWQTVLQGTVELDIDLEFQLPAARTIRDDALKAWIAFAADGDRGPLWVAHMLQAAVNEIRPFAGREAMKGRFIARLYPAGYSAYWSSALGPIEPDAFVLMIGSRQTAGAAGRGPWDERVAAALARELVHALAHRGRLRFASKLDEDVAAHWMGTFAATAVRVPPSSCAAVGAELMQRVPRASLEQLERERVRAEQGRSRPQSYAADTTAAARLAQRLDEAAKTTADCRAAPAIAAALHGALRAAAPEPAAQAAQR